MIKFFTTGPVATHTYIASCSETKRTALIDAGVDTFDLVKKYLEDNQLQLDWILLTHSHWDHIADLSKYEEFFQLPVHMHYEDKENVVNPGSDQMITPFDIEPVTNLRFLANEQIINLGNTHIKAIHTPGHTPGGLCFYWEEENVLFSGDTIFADGIGRIDFPTSEPKRMDASLETLSQLPKSTRILAGHGPEGSLEQWIALEEKQYLPSKDTLNKVKPK